MDAAVSSANPARLQDFGFLLCVQMKAALNSATERCAHLRGLFLAGSSGLRRTWWGMTPELLRIETFRRGSCSSRRRIQRFKLHILRDAILFQCFT